MDWTSKLTPIEGTPYFQSENGNIYCKHCLFIQSGPLHAKQISDCLKELLGNSNFVVNTVLVYDRYSCKTYVWFDNEEDFDKIISGQVIIPPFPLNEDQINSLPEKDLIDGKLFAVTISPTFVSLISHERKRNDQFFINDISHPSYSEELLHCIFDRFAISSKTKKVKVSVSEKMERSGNYWALVQFENAYDCAFAYRLTHTVNCRDRSGKIHSLHVNYGKILHPLESTKCRKK